MSMRILPILLPLAALLIGLGAGRYLLVPSVAELGIDPSAADPIGIVEQPCIERELPADGPERAVARAFMLSRDFGQVCRYAQRNAELLASGEPVRLVMMGDSITQGWPDKQPDLFTQGIVGRGIGGQTTSQMLLRFRADVIALKPKAVHIMAGTNDIAGNTGGLTFETLTGNYRSMAKLAQAHNIDVILASIPPASEFSWREGMAPAETIREVNRWLEAYAAENGFTYVDYHGALANGEGGLPEEFGPDGVHPNEAGYEVMREVLEPVIAAIE